MKTTVLYDDRVHSGDAVVDNDQLWLTPDDFAAASGWHLEPQGLCRGDACVQTNPAWRDSAGHVSLSAFAAHMGQPVVHDEANDVWAFGESVNARRDDLFSLQAPDFTLPDLDGKMHSLSDYRGRKVFMYSWGSY